MASDVSREALIEKAAEIESSTGTERRHTELAEEYTGRVPTEVFELACDIANEEGIHESLVLEAIARNIGVLDLDAEAGDDPAIDFSAPEWVNVSEPASRVQLERQVRVLARRLRHHLDAGRGASEGIRAFLAEPDIGYVTY